ncbi:MAG: HAD family hydrolase [Cyanobacteria bacterium P01_D01_bin.123]
MRYPILATDYDGTLATDGRVEDTTLDALCRFRRAGGTVFLVTGRRLGPLQQIFPHLDLCDRVVAENGAVLYHPASDRAQMLAAPPPATFISALKARGAEPLAIGQVIVATWQPYESAVVETIREFELDLQIILNKRAIMVLPKGVDKAFGLKRLLCDLGLSGDRVAGVGDAENDIHLLNTCGYKVAVANALPALKARADYVTAGERGSGVSECIDRLLELT